MSTPGYQALVEKASRCGNEGQEISGRGKAGSREVEQKDIAEIKGNRVAK